MRKIIRIIATGAFVLVILLYVFLPYILKLTILKDFSKSKTSEAYVMPLSRQLSSQTRKLQNYPFISCFGLKFKTPWGKPIKRKDWKLPSEMTQDDEISKNEHAEKYLLKMDKSFRKSPLVSYTFKNKKSVAISNNQMPSEMLHFLSDDKLVKFLFNKKFASVYDFDKFILNNSPDEITFFTPRKTVIAKSILIILKAVMMPAPGIYGVYNFETNNVKGFQFGNPEKNKKVLVELFDSHSHQYQLIFIKNKITQDEIDFILSSIITSQQ